MWVTPGRKTKQNKENKQTKDPKTNKQTNKKSKKTEEEQKKRDGSSCSRRRSSTSSGHHGEEDEHSGAAAFSEQNPRDLHSKHSSPTNSDQNCSVRDDLDTHSSQLTDSDNLVLSEDGQDLMSV